ncbi:MAG: hypothetical protein AB9Q23_02020 [Candidatus Reddybacter sp.]
MFILRKGAFVVDSFSWLCRMRASLNGKLVSESFDDSVWCEAAAKKIKKMIDLEVVFCRMRASLISKLLSDSFEVGVWLK